MRSFLSLLLSITTAFSPLVVCGQSTAQDQDEVIRVRSNEVRLDVVVKDKKGRPIKDLKPEDFEIMEDGVPQKVESFRFISREAGSNVAEKKDDKSADVAAPVPTTPAKRSAPTVTALVFDRLSPEARALARKAGLAYAEEGMASGGFTGVFGIDQSLRTVQPFTDDAALIKEAVERATGTSTSTYVSGAAKIRENVERSIALDQQVSSAAATRQRRAPLGTVVQLQRPAKRRARQEPSRCCSRCRTRCWTITSDSNATRKGLRLSTAC